MPFVQIHDANAGGSNASHEAHERSVVQRGRATSFPDEFDCFSCPKTSMADEIEPDDEG